MSLPETPMLLRYWARVGGTLAKEFQAVRRSAAASQRLLDGVIVAGRDIVVVQVKRGRLGMYLMGQALFSRELMKPFKPASIRTVALCVKDDRCCDRWLSNTASK